MKTAGETAMCTGCGRMIGLRRAHDPTWLRIAPHNTPSGHPCTGTSRGIPVPTAKLERRYFPTTKDQP